jgi:hypothetical protein
LGGVRNNVAGTVADVLLSSLEKDCFNYEIWIGENCASCYYCNNNDGLYNHKSIFEDMTVTNGNGMIVEKKGKLHCDIIQKNGENLTAEL